MESSEYETMFRVEETHWWYRALHQFIFQTLEHELPDWRMKKILDAGCGTGAVLQRLGSPDRNIGIDLAPEAISFCKKRGLANVRQADITAIPFPDSSFDAVICLSVIYHKWVNPETALYELHRVLRPGGLLLLNGPAFNFLGSAHDEAVMTARRFRKPEFRALLGKAGFSIERLTYWTTLLFPLAFVARTLGASKMGRDFPSEGKSRSLFDLLFSGIMSVERQILKKTSLPFGVDLFAVATKRPAGN